MDKDIANGKKMRDLDELVGQAIIQGIKNKNEPLQPKKKTTTSTPQSSSLGAEDRGAVGPKSLPKIRTYTHDAAEALEQTNASVTRLQVTQEKRRRAGSPKGGKGIFFVVIIILGIVGIGGVYVAYTNYDRTPKEVAQPVAVERAALISYDAIIESQNDSHTDLLNQIDLENGITYLYNESVTLDQIISEHLQNIPSILARNLSDDFMIGTLSIDNEHVPFIIIKSAYKFTLPGMQQWEENLSTDFRNILSIENISNDTFLDVPHAEHILRTDDSITYAITKDGEVVITRDPKTAIEILTQF